ncbi:response regulator [Larkinella soli]|uniref:response regulator n=1 Tax=Larkinella soli TaxID=1770527 RepID=UPI0013E29172|nr:response regulator [Larkinella soli]
MVEPLQIFLADDDEEDAGLYSVFLQRLFPRTAIRTFPNGQALLDAVAGTLRGPDLILLDINMPIMSGFETLEKLRAGPKTRHTPIFMLTSSDYGRDVVRCHELGATTYFVKPTRLKDMNRVFNAIRWYWARRPVSIQL